MRRALICALLAGACGRSEPKSAPAPTPVTVVAPSAPADAAVAVAQDAEIALDAKVALARDAAPAPDAAVVPASARQLITAVVDDWTSTRATLRSYRRGDGGWQLEGAPWPAVIGKTGAAWGSGLHGAGAPAGRTGPTKREGDAKSPAGAFALRSSYGYADAPPAGTRLPYVAVDEPWKCIDDPRSKHYDQIVDQRTVEVDWRSAEDMRRADPLYTWVVDVAHNPERIAGGGSCIFLHVWRNETGATVGCTAMDEERLAALLAKLDPSAVFVLLPRAEYAALEAAWSLPAL